MLAAGEVRSTRPALSMVVASVRELEHLATCLGQLRSRGLAGEAELVVARAGDVGELAVQHPYARFVACSPGASVAELRAAGMRAAGGDIVAVTEDDCLASAEWLDQITRSFRAGSSA
jgi:hypothetical protein